MLTTVGLDLGDKTIQACFVDHHGNMDLLVEDKRELLRQQEEAVQEQVTEGPAVP